MSISHETPTIEPFAQRRDRRVAERASQFERLYMRSWREMLARGASHPKGDRMPRR